MNFDFTGDAAIVGYVITSILGFFIGQTGIITKALNLKFMRVERNIENESSMINKIIEENKDLKDKVIKLSAEIMIVKHQNERLQSQMSLILEYMKSIKVEDPFIEKILK